MPKPVWDLEASAALMRQVFEAISTVGFLKWRTEELQLGFKVTQEDRQAYCRHMDKTYWPEFQAKVKSHTDTELYDMLQDWRERAVEMGVKEYEKATGDKLLVEERENQGGGRER